MHTFGKVVRPVMAGLVQTSPAKTVSWTYVTPLGAGGDVASNLPAQIGRLDLLPAHSGIISAANAESPVFPSSHPIVERAR
jgi:hypothetical protein